MEGFFGVCFYSGTVRSELVSEQGCGQYVVCMVVYTVSNNFYCFCSKYGLDKKIWRTRSFSKMVNPTDEAFVMQVVN